MHGAHFTLKIHDGRGGGGSGLTLLSM